ncbi:sensor histidine kinase [Sedimentibacter saalensis]|uniref:sensor histidine kinase n=1 Tax=Sedimentibacter saalensis TaxID=130788 RepID=UPI0028A02049|nr:sensor histidine kinase [Sedimentibacter saalensis]MEA5094842.1 sensor histidine kinase [Sedimentibacter saalensis]
MEKYKKFLYILKAVIFISLFTSALYFESAKKQRLIILCLLFIAFLVTNMGKYFIKDKKRVYIMSFAADTALIYLIEFNSRLLINYFFHSFYIIVLLEATLTLQLTRGIILGTLIVLVSMIKYIYLIYYKFNLSSVSQMMFFFMINILILIIASFAQQNKQEKEKKDVLYKELLDAHRKLREYTDEVNRLSVIEERNRIARDIHDNLGHNMTALIMQLQMAEHYMKTGSSKTQEMLQSSIQTARDSLSSIREVVETLRGKERIISPEKAVRTLIDEFSQKTGAEINLNISGEVINDVKAGTALYHILQESLTNSVRHGSATRIDVELDYSETSVSFSIKDNGRGSESIKEGFGMKGIRERVDDFKGSVEFQSLNGFNVKGILYLEDV